MLSIFASEKPKATVSSIVADLTAKIADLKALQAAELERSDMLTEQAASLVTEANVATREAQRAEAVAKNLEALTLG